MICLSITVKNEGRLLSLLLPKIYDLYDLILIFNDFGDPPFISPNFESKVIILSSQQSFFRELDPCFYDQYCHRWNDNFDIRKRFNMLISRHISHGYGLGWLICLDVDELLSFKSFNKFTIELNAHSNVNVFKIPVFEAVLTKLSVSNPYDEIIFFKKNIFIIQFVIRLLRRYLSFGRPFFRDFYSFLIYKILTFGIYPNFFIFKKRLIFSPFFFGYDSYKSIVRTSPNLVIYPDIHTWYGPDVCVVTSRSANILHFDCIDLSYCVEKFAKRKGVNIANGAYARWFLASFISSSSNEFTTSLLFEKLLFLNKLQIFLLRLLGFVSKR